MKTPSIQVHRNGAAKAAKSQVKTSPRKAENIQIASTGKNVNLIEEAESALKELEQVGRAATAAVMMNALELESDGKEFSEGQLDLARHASREFKNDFAALTGSVAGVLSVLRSPADGMVRPANPFDSEVLLRPWITISNALTGLSHLISIQDYAFGQAGVYNSCGIAFTLCKKIEEVDQMLVQLYSKLSEVVRAIYSSMAKPERIAA